MAKAELLFAGTDDGVALFSEPGGIGRWLRIGRTLQGVQVASLWLDADDPQQVLASDGAVLWRSADGGQSWSEVVGGPAGPMAAVRGEPHLAWCVTQGALWKSRDSGQQWQRVAEGSWERPHAVATSGSMLAFAASHTIWLAGPQGELRSSTLPSPVTGLAGLPSPDGWYATSAGRLYRLEGVDWTPVPGAPPAPGALAVLGGKQPTLLLASGDGHVVRASLDGAWETPPDPAWPAKPSTIYAAPYHIDTAFAGAGGTLAFTSNRGRSWQVIRADLPVVRCVAAGRLM
jgi:hypothetical protein